MLVLIAVPVGFMSLSPLVGVLLLVGWFSFFLVEAVVKGSVQLVGRTGVLPFGFSRGGG